MSHKPKTINEIMSKCAAKTLLSIERDPDNDIINKMMQLVYADVENLPRSQGGGHRSHIISIMKPTLYKNLTTTTWDNLPNSVVYPTIPTNSTMDL